jgi:hypothetical protein
MFSIKLLEPTLNTLVYMEARIETFDIHCLISLTGLSINMQEFTTKNSKVYWLAVCVHNT